MESGSPIAYTALAEETPVQSSDGVDVGTVKRVLAHEGANLFDGLILRTPDGDRFVDAPEVGNLYERLVVLKITAEQAARLREPSPSPASVSLSPDDVAPTGSAGKVRGAARRLWDRITGRY
jgi:hypothetical protein